MIRLEFPAAEWKDYELVDSGGSEKLERFGGIYMSRPEPKALWDKSLSQKEWNSLVHTEFRAGAGFGRAGKEESGTWERRRRMEDRWQIGYTPAGGPELRLRLGLTAFKHVGVFPEQAPNWDYIYRQARLLCRQAETQGRTRPKVLNLFAYTGAASLAARAAGAEVTHLDSVKQVVSWARENMESSRLDGIHWVLEDAMKFAEREVRRGHRYQGLILDPPAYGHGPDGEKWKLDDCLFALLRTAADLLEPADGFLVLNLYSNGYTASLGETLVREAFGLRRAAPSAFQLETGELCLRDRSSKVLPLSIFVRLKR